MIGQDPLEAFKARNADASTNALAVLQKAAVEHENTFEAMIEVAKVYAGGDFRSPVRGRGAVPQKYVSRVSGLSRLRSG